MERRVIEFETNNDENKSTKINLSKNWSKSMNKIEDDNDNKTENKEFKFVEYNQKLYQILFSKKMNHIKIKCNNTNNVNDLFTKKLFFDECKQSNKYLEFLGNISTIFDAIKKTNNIIIKSQDNSFILIINFVHLAQKYPLKILLQKEEDLLKIIEELRNEIEILKIRLKNEEDSKKENLKIYNSNICYNLDFDNTLYKLDEVYDAIIKEKQDLGLINFVIKKLFSNNIKNCILKDKYSTDSKNISIFKSSISSINNLLIVLITTKNKRFGVFSQNNSSKYNLNNDNNNDISYCGNCNEKINRSIKRLFYTCCKKGKGFIFSFDELKTYEKSNENPNI